MPNPIMPLSIWKLYNFAALWVGGFVTYGGYQTSVYYTTPICQEVSKFSPGETAIRFLPMGAVGFIFSLGMSRALGWFNPKWMLVTGMVISSLAPVPSAVMQPGNIDFWKHVFPTTVMSVAGVTIVNCTITVILLDSVPVNIKSLCGGMVNTAFQIGSGAWLALASAVVQAVDIEKGHSQLRQYETGLWCVVGLSGNGVMATLIGVKDTGGHVGGLVVRNSLMADSWRLASYMRWSCCPSRATFMIQQCYFVQDVLRIASLEVGPARLCFHPSLPAIFRWNLTVNDRWFGPKPRDT